MNLRQSIEIKSHTQKSGEKNMRDNINKIYRNIKSKGFIFSYEDLSNFI